MTAEKGCARGEKWRKEVEQRRQKETKENKKKNRRMRKESGGCR